MENFSSFDLPKVLVNSLAALEYKAPTPIQAEAIPAALEGKDVLGSAQTGTGKTAAFGIPLIARLLKNHNETGLIITPTRELAMQVRQSLMGLIGKAGEIKTALLIGGEPIGRQLKQLRRNPRIFIGTPGRINDHLTSGSVKFDNVSYLVLDETDRMLDMGFSIQINEILQHVPDQRQTMLFSATLPSNIVKMSNSYMNDPVRVAIGRESNPAQNIKHEVVETTEEDKYDVLLNELHNRAGSAIIFMKTKYATEKMAKRLRKAGHKAEAIHGDLRQNKRMNLIKDFRNLKFNILVATDVASRGLDIPHVAHILNYDLPQCPEDYIHRIGRTARAGAEGEAMCLLTPKDKRNWAEISYLMDPEANPKPKGGKSGGRGKGSNGKVKKFSNRSKPGAKGFSSKKKPQGKSQGKNGSKRSFGRKNRAA